MTRRGLDLVEYTVREQKKLLKKAAKEDSFLRRFLEEWEKESFSDLVCFGTFFYTEYLSEWEAAHHHGFQQGVEAVLRRRHYRKKKETKEEPEPAVSPKFLWGGVVLGALGVTVCLPFLVGSDTWFVWRFMAVMVSAPALFLNGYCAFQLIFRRVDASRDPADAGEDAEAWDTLEYDPQARAAFLEEEERKAHEDFMEYVRTQGKDLAARKDGGGEGDGNE